LRTLELLANFGRRRLAIENVAQAGALGGCATLLNVIDG
jgi:hypothetical protein